MEYRMLEPIEVVETIGQRLTPGVNFNFNPSLTSRAAISVTASLWYHENILSRNVIRHALARDESAFDRKVIENAQNFSIPENLKENIIVLVRSIKNQLGRWMVKHTNVVPNGVYLYDSVSWSSVGLIDFNKTASNIIEKNNLTPTDAFKLACVSCSYDHIYKLWPIVMNEQEFDESGFHTDKEIDYWVLHLRRTYQSSCISLTAQRLFFQEACTLAFYDGNLAGIYFFYRKLNTSERSDFQLMTEHSIKSLFNETKPIILIFLLSLMNGTQQTQFLKSDPVSHLLCFLRWPLQHFFLGVVDRMADCLTEVNFCEVLSFFIAKMKIYKNEAPLYKKLCIAFWVKCPVKLRNFYVKETFTTFFSTQFRSVSIKDVFNILFSGACDEETLYATLDKDANAMLYFLLEDNKLTAFKVLVRKFILTDKASFEKFEKCVAKYFETFPKYLRT